MQLSVYLLKVIVKILWQSYCGFRPWILSHYGSDTSLWIKTETITINTFLPMRNKLIYSCSIKIPKKKFPASEFNELLQSIFCLPLVAEAFSLKKVIEILEEVVVSWQEVRWIWWMRQNFIAQFIQLWSVDCVTCHWTLLWRRIGPFLLTNAGFRHCSFGYVSLICWAYFSEVMISLGFRKL